MFTSDETYRKKLLEELFENYMKVKNTCNFP